MMRSPVGRCGHNRPGTALAQHALDGMTYLNLRAGRYCAQSPNFINAIGSDGLVNDGHPATTVANGGGNQGTRTKVAHGSNRSEARALAETKVPITPEHTANRKHIARHNALWTPTQTHGNHSPTAPWPCYASPSCAPTKPYAQTSNNYAQK